MLFAAICALPARAQTAGSVDSAFNPGVTGSYVTAAVQPDGKILLGGIFTSVGGQPRNNIARLNADGSVESTATFNPGTGASGEVQCVTVQADGKILLGGQFTTVNGTARKTHLAAQCGREPGEHGHLQYRDRREQLRL